ncbi:hypothetical protein F511_37862 [Dorcoceras hygrometricum]|uniref:Uncharacterized protein n=1 Tax=Dorcoceras hygrometricum TaxID=472368 RepID=A0A2Z7AYL0_9LAMI|nr:hypothetical protein F511_37862 [Dorcoceras hygrometricum]
MITRGIPRLNTYHTYIYWDFRDAGIDQLNFHSVQPGYLKFLQMGNADPHKTKAGNKYEVKPQYEERTKQINMQHAINQCYECMRAAKEISQLGQCINRQNISGHLYTTANQPRNHRSVNYRNPSVLTAQWLKLQEMLTQKLNRNNGRNCSTKPATHERAGPSGFLNSLLLASKLVSMGRASLKESSATKNVKNRDWNRRKMAMENHGEQ